MSNTTPQASRLATWTWTRGLTFDLLETLTIEQLNAKLFRPGLDTPAKHLRELALVEAAYTRLLRGEPLDFAAVRGLTFGTESFTLAGIDQLRDDLRAADAELERTASGISDWSDLVDAFGSQLSKSDVLDLLSRHETLHHGQLIAYAYSEGWKLPQSWKVAWALP